MQRGFHLLLLGAILPGVVLPGQVAICLSALIVRASHDGCCGAPRSDGGSVRSCCAAHRRTSSDGKGAAGVLIRDAKGCRCCLVFSPEKHVTPKPEVQGTDSPDLCQVVDALVGAEASRVSTTVESLARPTSHAPPDDARSLPLLI